MNNDKAQSHPQPRRPNQIGRAVLLSEPRLAFSDASAEPYDKHPLRGLDSFGPSTQHSLAAVSTEGLRIALVAPVRERDKIVTVFKRLQQPDRTTSPPYWPEYRGFQNIYSVPLGAAQGHVHEWFDERIEARVRESQAATVEMAQILATSASRLDGLRSDFDVVAIYLPDRWEAGFRDVEEGFDLHDYVKSAFAPLGIPTQLLRDRLFTRPSVEVNWTLSVALYAKLGGTPWTLASTAPRTAFIGLAYAVRSRRGDPERHSDQRFVTCCSQLFEAEGAGVEFTLYDTVAAGFEGDNPFLSREAMRAVTSRTLALYQQRHSFPPDRIVVHKTTRFTSDEIAGAHEGLATIPDVELLQVQEQTPWRAASLQARGGSDNYPVRRGAMLILDDSTMLLWTQGNAPDVVGRNWYKEGVEIPRPLLLRRWAGRSPADAVAVEVLGLTKMNVNNGTLYDLLPSTLTYAGMLGRVVKRARLPKRTYALRLFI